MTRFDKTLSSALKNIPGIDEEEIRKAQRTAKVRAMWSELVDPLILEHTNGVYIFTNGDDKEMHVYVDESIFASELNNQRELLKLRMKERFNESIARFEIHISKGKWKKIHPYEVKHEDLVLQPLTSEERGYVDEVSDRISDDVLRKKFKKAMISDLEWKKSEKR